MRSLLCLVLLAATSVAAEPGILSETGIGVVSYVPDCGHITVGVTTLRQSAPTALTDNSIAAKSMFATLDKLGVSKDDIKTLALKIDEHHNNDGRRTTVDGYEATNLVRVTVKDLKTLGNIVDAVVSSGANRIQNIEFSSTKIADITEQARIAAVKDAVAKGTTVANALGIKLGAPSSVVEQQYNQPRENYYSRSISSAGDAPPISGGELSTSVAIQINWSIAPGDGKAWGK